ncbi:MAG: S-methyl-5'-thioadenosine phosphorylase, partial [Planctomycetota bacterium]
LYDLEGLEGVRSVEVATPFGRPSDRVVTGRFGGVPLAFLARHGRGHRHLPTEIPYRANVWALKSLGVERILAVSAVGSMREDVAPGDLVIVDQFFDRTRQRPSTFFGRGLVAHVHFADPVCAELGDLLHEGAKGLGLRVHRGGTYLCMEGPAFSTRAESRIYRRWGVDVIGMTNLQEAKLAREAEVCYATIAMATDYDCWHETEEDVTVEAVLRVLRENVANVRNLIAATVPRIPRERRCPCANALERAILTSPEAIPPATRKRLDLLVGKYLPTPSRARRSRRS